MSFVDYLTQYNPLTDQGDISTVLVYKHFIQKEREVYKTLNLLKQSGQLLIGLIWVPVKYEEALFAKKNEVQQQKNLNPHIVKRQIDPELTIPTFFEDNEFTFAPQQVIDQYDTPKFKEANPGVFTAVTFPFLFGVMFGDIFAGSILTGFGLYLIWASPTKGSLV